MWPQSCAACVLTHNPTAALSKVWSGTAELCVSLRLDVSTQHSGRWSLYLPHLLTKLQGWVGNRPEATSRFSKVQRGRFGTGGLGHINLQEAGRATRPLPHITQAWAGCGSIRTQGDSSARRL